MLNTSDLLRFIATELKAWADFFRIGRSGEKTSYIRIFNDSEIKSKTSSPAYGYLREIEFKSIPKIKAHSLSKSLMKATLSTRWMDTYATPCHGRGKSFNIINDSRR